MSEMLKQKAIAIANAFTKWNLWQGGQPADDEYKPGDVVNLGVAFLFGYASQVNTFQGYFYLPKMAGSEVSGVSVTYTTLSWLRGNGADVRALTYVSSAIVGNRLTINVSTTSTLTRFSIYLLAVSGCVVTFL